MYKPCNETTFLATYASGILGEEIEAAVEKIENWLGKLVVITCDEVTTNKPPQVIECAWHTTGVDSVVFNTQIYDMHSDSNQSDQSGYSAVHGASSTAILNKIPSIPYFLTLRERKTQFDLNSGFTPSLMLGRVSVTASTGCYQQTMSGGCG